MIHEAVSDMQMGAQKRQWESPRLRQQGNGTDDWNAAQAHWDSYLAGLSYGDTLGRAKAAQDRAEHLERRSTAKRRMREGR